MASKYKIFIKVIEEGSFTRVASRIGYSQSAISQAIKNLEGELGTTLIDRRKDGISLTPDGRQFFPYIMAVYSAEESLHQKISEMKGLEKSDIRIGTFTSVSRNILPGLINDFKVRYPEVNFVLKQGEYTSISRWIKDGSIDFGFVDAQAVSDLDITALYQDEMVAVLPQDHRLAEKEAVSLKDLAGESLILLDEGEYSLTLNAFQKRNIEPHIEYEVYDDYSIIAMVKQGLGISMLYRRVLNGLEDGIAIKPLTDRIERSVALAWDNYDTMPYAARRFVDYIIKEKAMF